MDSEHPGLDTALCADLGTAQGQFKDSPLSSDLISALHRPSVLTELSKTVKMGPCHLCSLTSSGLRSDAPRIGFKVIIKLPDWRKIYLIIRNMGLNMNKHGPCHSSTLQVLVLGNQIWALPGATESW